MWHGCPLEMVYSGHHVLSWKISILLIYINVALLSHTHKQMQDKINITTEEVSSQTSLKVNRNKTKVLHNNTHQIEPITLAGESLDDVTSFTYLGSVVDQKGGSDQDVKARIQKARVDFI